MPTGLVHDPVYQRHATGPRHPERPERLEAIDTMLHETGLIDAVVTVPFHTVDESWLLKMHDRNYLHRIHAACSYGVPFVDVPDSVVCRASELVAKQAVGGCLEAAKQVPSALYTPSLQGTANACEGVCLEIWDWDPQGRRNPI